MIPVMVKHSQSMQQKVGYRTYQNISGALEYRTIIGMPVVELSAMHSSREFPTLGEHKAEKEPSQPPRG